MSDLTTFSNNREPTTGGANVEHGSGRAGRISTARSHHLADFQNLPTTGVNGQPVAVRQPQNVKTGMDLDYLKTVEDVVV